MSPDTADRLADWSAVFHPGPFGPRRMPAARNEADGKM
jgi:hypothetical protein